MRSIRDELHPIVPQRSEDHAIFRFPDPRYASVLHDVVVEQCDISRLPWDLDGNLILDLKQAEEPFARDGRAVAVRWWWV